MWTRPTPWCKTCGSALTGLSPITPRWWSLGWMTWCPYCSEQKLKRVGILVVTGRSETNVLFLYTCGHCGKSARELAESIPRGGSVKRAPETTLS